MGRRFFIVLPNAGRFDVFLADGVSPGRHMATLDDRLEANRVSTLLAWHYRVPSRELGLEDAEPPPGVAP